VRLFCYGEELFQGGRGTTEFGNPEAILYTTYKKPLGCIEDLGDHLGDMA
jgi:hypothetical protein